MHAFNSIAFGFIIFGNWNGAPLYLIIHLCIQSIAVCRFDKMWDLLAQRCYQPLRWTTDLCTGTNLEYKIYMIVLRDNTSSNISLFKSTMVDDVTCSPPYLAACNSLAMCSFSAIKNRTLELVDLTYVLVALANVVGFLCTSDTITHSSNCAGDMWTSKVGTLHDCTTLCCD